MKTFKLTLVIMFILAYAFILSGCASTPHLHESIKIQCHDSVDSWYYENELTFVVVQNQDCAIIKSESFIKELK